MIANNLDRGLPATFVTVKFIVTNFEIETAIIAIWLAGLKATKKAIENELKKMFRSGGQDSTLEWVDEHEAESYIKRARKHAQKLYPTFYK